MRAGALLPIVLTIAGAACIADAVVRGAAGVALVVVFPIVYGSDAEFLLGVGLLIGGLLTLPIALPAPSPAAGVGSPSAVGALGEVPTTEVGGVVLIGPFPIFVGGWRTVSRRVRVAAAIVGTVLVVGAVVLFVVR